MSPKTTGTAHQPLTELQRTRLQRASRRYEQALETAQRTFERKTAPARAALDRAVAAAQEEHDAAVAEVLGKVSGGGGASS